MVQAFVFGLQLNVLQTDSLEAEHVTHWFACPVTPVKQTFLPVIWVQSVSAAHGRQVLMVELPVVTSHFDAAAVLQSVFDRHATQLFVAVLHCGFAVVVQDVLARHSTQVLLVVSQTLRPLTLAQSELLTHSTQELVAVLHAVFVPEQCEFAVHATHVLVVAQAGVGATQYLSPMQATQV